MRVAIDTSYAAQGPSGTGVYIERLVEALRARGNVEVVELRQPRFRRGGGNPLRSAANAVLDELWIRVLLPRRARGADVLHHPLPAHGGSLPQVITVHDVAFLTHPEWFDPGWRRVAERRHRRAVARAEVTVCVSEAVARQVEGAREKVVAPHGPGQALDPGERHPEHFLYVGDDEPRKHVGDLIAAWRAYREGGGPVPLVLAGRSAARAGDGIRGEPDPDLAHLLGGALALVHPARDEGFGLTLLEAMAAGVPVVAVRTEAAAEVCGDAALLVEPGGLAGAMAAIAADGDLRGRLAAAGRERAAAFSWDRSAEAHERAYRLAAR